MADGLSHVLLAFGLFTATGWVIGWLDRRWIAVGMVGSLLPDLSRLDLILDDSTISRVVGIPFDWGGVHTLGGVVLLGALGAVLFETRQEQRRGFGLLVAGGCSHLLVDAVKRWADGAGNVPLYPVSWWRPPTPGLYVSADRWVLGVAVAVAVTTVVVDRFYGRGSAS
ncbi:metal-dependent hydrolase [Halovenus sp. WSH3]|uniref:Metal-dependent hydrolase n=1 Tax=Halovenus carboxidivorans TaxID=2692199 RepID=A0A6B0T6B2_9EURY|nr:metal-dependent hydrolase [Halovenus carboxidivorans]MXR50410.1 metal-dependent hydrolase [Halovenus carboxidivorans]